MPRLSVRTQRRVVLLTYLASIPFPLPAHSCGGISGNGHTALARYNWRATRKQDWRESNVRHLRVHFDRTVCQRGHYSTAFWGVLQIHPLGERADTRRSFRQYASVAGALVAGIAGASERRRRSSQ